MIPLIQCSDEDAQRYYQGGLVFHAGQPVKFLLKEGDNAVIEDGEGNHHRVKYGDLLVTIIPPFYSASGDYLGHVAGRRTSRTIPYHRRNYPDIMSMLSIGDVPPMEYTEGVRLNKDFRTQRERHINMLLYRTEVVGFVEDNVYYVSCPFLKERLEKLNVSVAEINQTQP